MEALPPAQPGTMLRILATTDLAAALVPVPTSYGEGGTCAGVAELLEADLLALQEVDAGPGGGNEAEELFGPLGYQVAYERRQGDERADPGTAVASRHPITRRQLIELPDGGAVLAVRIEASDDAFWFCCAKAVLFEPGREGEREAEALALDMALVDLAAGDSIPPILAGDFDATPEAASMRFLAGLQSLEGRSTLWWTPG